ncbi:MAG TPA: Hsp20/alpha crystallin family protein [Chloroflexota bacterium]|jgi:HSP20 family protein|nr:Hsp20/alpha crystallin family protein [Chloroflexota bacterium]
MRVRFRYVTTATGHNAEQQELERLFHELWHVRQRTILPAGEWRPPTDVYETPERLVVKMELAGVPEDAIEITLYADHLVVSGTRMDREPAGAQAAYREAGIHYGPFRGEVRLPQPVDGEQVVATLDNGFLTITLPRARER